MVNCPPNADRTPTFYARSDFANGCEQLVATRQPPKSVAFSERAAFLREAGQARALQLGQRE